MILYRTIFGGWQPVSKEKAVQLLKQRLAGANNMEGTIEKHLKGITAGELLGKKRDL